MPKITFVTADGGHHSIDAEVGDSVMQTAMANDVPGIVAECGGACICSTCHVVVDVEWVDTVGPPGEEEELTMDFAPERSDRSRLSCQITVAEELDGLTVHVPASQA